MKDYTHPIPVVRLIVSDKNGRILLLRRSNTFHSSGAWCLPGGKVDYNDTVETTCKKELFQETGLSCLNVEFLFYQNSLPPAAGEMHCINLYFKCEAEGKIRLNEESSKFAWIAPQEIDNYEIAFRNDKALLRYWSENTSTSNL